jgi:anti-anti-sigma factor
MEISVTQTGDQVRFTLAGRIDEKAAEQLKEKFLSLSLASIKLVIFDFNDVLHIGSAGIGKLLLFYKDISTVDGTMRIENAQPTVYDLMKLVKLDTVFSVSSK